MHARFVVTMTLVLLVALCLYQVAQALEPWPTEDYTYVIVDIPSPTLPTGAGRFLDISDTTLVLGTVTDGGTFAPFLAQLQPRRDRISAPRFFTCPGVLTLAVAVNAFGQVAGNCLTEQVQLGFVYTPTQTHEPYQFLTLPEAIYVEVTGMNDLGQVIGYSSTGTFPDAGFLWHQGTVTPIAVPGAQQTVPMGINNHADIVGVYTDAGGLLHGFLLVAGVYSDFAVPDATMTTPFDINDAGSIVGFTTLPDGQALSFLLQEGQWFAIDVPQEDVLILDAASLNNTGQIAGRLVLQPPTPGDLAPSRGFVASPTGLQPGRRVARQVGRRLLRQMARAERRQQHGIQVALDPCAAEQPGVIVPLRLRRLCRQ